MGFKCFLKPSKWGTIAVAAAGNERLQRTAALSGLTMLLAFTKLL